MNQVIISAIIPQEGTAEVYEVPLQEIREYVRKGKFVNFVGHETVKLLGVDPAKERRELNEPYDEAIVLKPKNRLDFGKEYTVDELMEIGVTCWFIRWQRESVQRWR